MKILNNLCVSAGETLICYAIKVNSRKLFPERVPKFYDSTSEASTQYYLQVSTSQIETKIPLVFQSRKRNKGWGPDRAVLAHSLLSGLCCSSSQDHCPHHQGWSTVSHTCPSKDSNYTTLALWDETASQEWCKQIPEQIYRKSQQEVSFFLLSVVFTNPMESLQFYLCHFRKTLTPLFPRHWIICLTLLCMPQLARLRTWFNIHSIHPIPVFRNWDTTWHLACHKDSKQTFFMDFM